MPLLLQEHALRAAELKGQVLVQMQLLKNVTQAQVQVCAHWARVGAIPIFYLKSMANIGKI